MSRFLALCAAVLVLALVPGGCARDTNDEEEGERYPIEVQLAFKTLGSFDPANWYYMVFNFTAAPSTAVNTAPIDFVSLEDRGRNWELYVAFNPSNTGTDTVVSLQRPAVPTILPTAAGPADAASALLNNDNLTDIVAVCRIAGEVQVIPGREAEAFETIYFDEAVSINFGPQPMRVFTGQFGGDATTDILVLFAGEDGQSPFLRYLINDGAGTLTAPDEDFLLEPGIPIDALSEDLTGDGLADFIFLETQETGGTGDVYVYVSLEEGGFADPVQLTTGEDPVQLSAGQLDGDGLDLSVACRGPAGGSGLINLYAGSGTGTFSDYTVPQLQLPGPCTGAVIAQMLEVGSDAIDDVLAGYRDTTGQGMLRVFVNNEFDEDESPLPEEAFGTLVVDIESEIQPDYIAAADTSGDDRLDALVLEGTPGSGGNTFMIQRGLTESPDGLSTDFNFVWDPEPITYITGLEPSRFYLTDIDNNGHVDVIAPNSADAEGGNSLSLFYGLGKDNFTSADIYWTDEAPELLTQQEWYIRHSIGPNFFELVLDPALFYDLARRQPENFLVDFMTATSGIDLIHNEDQEGLVIEHMSQVINVPMTIGHFNDEQNSPRANAEVIPDPAQDIVDWRVEVF